MVGLLSGVAGVNDMFAIGSGSAVSIAMAAAVLSFTAALALCRGRAGRRVER